MPEISRFYGIVVAMFYNDHAPPHFHVRYGEQRALIGIESLSVLEGHLSARTRDLVVEWAGVHREELMENWNQGELRQPMRKIAPLE